MPLFNLESGKRSNVDLFFAYYPRLREWAFQLTRHDRAEAEDLVHDLYIRVVHIVRPMAEIENLDAYLFKVLRNLYSSRMRRAGRDPIHDLSIVDYDSLELGLAAADRRELLFVRSHLREICSYACRRKSSNRSAGILILRFFLGYYPGELARIVRVPRHVVDQALYVARNEVRAYLGRSSDLLPISSGKPASVSFGTGQDTESSQGLFRHLREAVFSAAEGGCFDGSALERRYGATGNQPPLSAQELAHLVSCPVCLDRVNEILHLPLLEARSPEYGLDRDGSSGPGEGGSGGGSANGRGPGRRSTKRAPALSRMERRARELYEHRPGRLQIVVEGEVWSSQRITAEVNELSLRLPPTDEPPFLEVISEQGLCMVFLQAEAPVSVGDLEQVETALFSDDRSLVLSVSFAAGGASVHVLYRDPLVREAAACRLGSGADGPEATGQRPVQVGTPDPPEQLDLYRSHGLSARIAGVFASLFDGRRLSLPGGAASLAVGLLVAGLLAVGLLAGSGLWRRTAPSLSPDAFLERAETAERIGLTSGQQEVVAERVRIRTSSRSIERVIHRDRSGRRRPGPQTLDAQTAGLRERLTGVGVSWDDPLSAAGFEQWRRHAQVTRDSVQENGGTLLTLTTAISGGDLAEESLTVRASDFHPVARTICFRDAGAVEIAELDYRVMPWSAADPDWFEPAGRAAAGQMPATHATAGLPHLPSDLELDEAELAARTVLNQLHADTDEQIGLVRGATGIEVRGIVDTDARRRELVSRLLPIPNVHPSILSVEEIGSRPPSRPARAGQPAGRIYAVEAKASPLEQFLRERGLPMSRLEPVSENLADGSLRMMQSGTHLSELAARFGETDHLPADRQAQLEQLSHNYTEAILAGILGSRQLLLSLGFARSDPPPESPPDESAGRSLDEQLRLYRQLCLEMVSNETGQQRSAPEIAREILSTGERMRVRLAGGFVRDRRESHQ